jgi:hypothetical protein
MGIAPCFNGMSKQKRKKKQKELGKCFYCVILEIFGIANYLCFAESVLITLLN